MVGKSVDFLPPKTRARLTAAKVDYSIFRFKETGYPDFSPWIAKHPETGKLLRLEGFEYQIDRERDNRLADKLAGITRKFRKENKLTWHHSEIEGVMELVPSELHTVIPHTGGYYLWGGRG